MRREITCLINEYEHKYGHNYTKNMLCFLGD